MNACIVREYVNIALECIFDRVNNLAHSTDTELFIHRPAPITLTYYLTKQISIIYIYILNI